MTSRGLVGSSRASQAAEVAESRVPPKVLELSQLVAPNPGFQKPTLTPKYQSPP